MPTSKSVDEVVATIGHMSREERDELILKMAKMEDIWEDIDDVRDLIRYAHEPTKPFDEFLKELRSEGHDV